MNGRNKAWEPATSVEEEAAFNLALRGKNVELKAEHGRQDELKRAPACVHVQDLHFEAGAALHQDTPARKAHPTSHANLTVTIIDTAGPDGLARDPILVSPRFPPLLSGIGISTQ